MINYDYITQENIQEHNTNWPHTPDGPYRIFIIGGFWFVKKNKLINPIKQQDDDDYNVIDKHCLYLKDPVEAKYQYLFKLRKKVILEISKNKRLLLSVL